MYHHPTRVIRIELSRAHNPPSPRQSSDQKERNTNSATIALKYHTSQVSFPSSLYSSSELFFFRCIRSPQRLFQGESPRATTSSFRPRRTIHTHGTFGGRLGCRREQVSTQKEEQPCRELRKFLMPDLRPLARRTLTGSSWPAFHGMGNQVKMRRSAGRDYSEFLICGLRIHLDRRGRET